MTLMKVNLSDEEVTPEFLRPLFQEIHHQLRKGPYSISKEEAYKMFFHGAKEGVKYFGLDESFLDRIDQKGQSNLMQLKTKDLQMREVLPWTSQFMGAYNAPGNYLKGNHFLEVQKADKLLHKEHAKKFFHGSQYVSRNMIKGHNSHNEIKLKKGIDYDIEQLYEFANFVLTQTLTREMDDSYGKQMGVNFNQGCEFPTIQPLFMGPLSTDYFDQVPFNASPCCLQIVNNIQCIS